MKVKMLRINAEADLQSVKALEGAGDGLDRPHVHERSPGSA